VGVAELSAARAEADANRQLAGAAVVMVAQGSEEIGAAEGLSAADAARPKRSTRKPAAGKAGASASKAGSSAAKPQASSSKSAGKAQTGKRASAKGRAAKTSEVMPDA